MEKKTKITKVQFLKDVRTEIENIKKYARKSEIQKLDFDTFNPLSVSRCIYGQMSGACDSSRGSNLIYKCCERVMPQPDTEETVKRGGWKHIQKYLNGHIKKTFKSGKAYKEARAEKYAYLSSLEAYIQLPSAKTKNIISYLRGESERLVL